MSSFLYLFKFVYLAILKVKLKALKSELKRRPVYYYPTIEQCQEKLKQLDARQMLLTKKEGKDLLQIKNKIKMLFLEQIKLKS